MNGTIDCPGQRALRIVLTFAGASLTEHFANVEDPRAEHITDRKLLYVVIVAICVVSGEESLQFLRDFRK